MEIRSWWAESEFLGESAAGRLPSVGSRVECVHSLSWELSATTEEDPLSSELAMSVHDSRETSILTFRSVVFGSLMCVLIGIIGPYWTFYLGTSTLFLDYSVGGGIFLLFLLVLILNGIVGRIYRPLAFRRNEMVVVTAMMLIAGAITTMGLVGYLIPNITAPYYLATVHNQWNIKLWPHLPNWLSPLDPGGKTIAITKFFQGVAPGDPMPWEPWVKPLLIWSVFLFGLYACMTSLMAIMRKQWVDHEHLSFPIAQVPEELCNAAVSPWRKPSILVSVFFWVGFAIPFVVGSMTGLHHYFPTVPTITLARAVSEFGPIPLQVRLSFAVLGFTFLIPNRVAFSLWFLNLLSFAVRSYLVAYNLDMKENLGIYGAAGYPIMAHQGMGAMLVFIGAGLWFSRQHLRRVFLCAMGRGQASYDEGEPASYRSSLLLLLVGLAVMVVWIWQTGLPLHYTIIFVLVALLIFYGLTRVVAQCGVSVTIAPLIAPSFMTSTFGAGNFSAGSLSALSMAWVWCSDIRTTVMSSAAHAMYLARRRAHHLVVILLLAAGITVAVASAWTVRLGYQHGAANLSNWFFTAGPQRLFDWTVREIDSGLPPDPHGMLWTGVGAGIMLLLVLAHRTLFWWPVHPVGFIICSVGWTDRLWLTIFIAWLAKLAVVRFGGAGMFGKARELFLGMILGQFTVAGTWAIVDTITGTVGNQIFWI